jgi:hypothetical protein
MVKRGEREEHPGLIFMPARHNHCDYTRSRNKTKKNSQPSRKEESGYRPGTPSSALTDTDEIELKCDGEFSLSQDTLMTHSHVRILCAGIKDG